jgi:hypothetical protein
VFASLRPEEGTDPTKLLDDFKDQKFNLAYTQVYDEFVAAGLGDISSYAPIFGLDEAQVGLALHFSPRYFVQSKHVSIDDSQYGGPCNQSDTPGWHFSQRYLLSKHG